MSNTTLNERVPEVAPATAGGLLLVPILLLILATAFLYRSPYSASDLEIVPDSVEYAVTGQRIATLGRYDIEIDHVAYPPRYAPGFPLLVLAPIYKLLPGEIGSGILGVLGFALVGAMSVYAIGCRLGGPWAGAISVACLLAFKEYHTLSRYIMTDVPAASLGLLGCLLYLRMWERPRARDYAAAGLLVGLCTAFRYEGAALVLPFLALAMRGCVRRLDAWRSVFIVILPTLFVAAATAAYNAAVFGDWRRSGYHFWCPVPYDYPALVWSARYVHANLHALAAKQSVMIMVLGLIGLGLLRIRRPVDLAPAVRFLTYACVPLGILHLFYFSTGVRFYLLWLTVWCAFAGAGLATLLPQTVRSRLRLLPCMLAVSLLAIPLLLRAFAITPQRRIVADSLARETPRNAVIVTGLDPVYLDPLLLRGTQRQVVPITRGVEYASKAIVWRRIAHPEPPPTAVGQERSPGMLRGGAREVFSYTADEAPYTLLALAHSGVPVYIDLSFAPKRFPLNSLFPPGAIIDVPGFPSLKRLRPGIPDAN